MSQDDAPDLNSHPFTPMTSFGPVPAGWMWGTATAAHQIEGGNTNNDWWAFEHTPGAGTTESSGDAADCWNRWLEDLAAREGDGPGLLSLLRGVEPHRARARASSPWPRSTTTTQMMVAAHEMGLKTSVTFHRFTTPLGCAARVAGPTRRSSTGSRANVRHRVQHLGDQIDMAATFNEPNVVALAGTGGQLPPGRRATSMRAAAATEELRRGAHAARRRRSRLARATSP